MRKSLLLAKSNLRRGRAQTVSIFMLVLLASMLLNIWLMLTFDYKKNFERCHDRLNAEHVTMLLDNASDELHSYLSEQLTENRDIEEYCMDKALLLVASINYSGGKLSSDFFVLEKETALTHSVGKYEIIEDSNYKSGIYLPMLFGEGDNYSVGDKIHIVSGNHSFDYTVCGFYNSAMTGSQNCGMCAFLLTEDAYKALKEEAVLPESLLLSIRIQEKSQSEDFEAMIKNIISEKFPYVQAFSNCYTLVSNTRYISQMICSGIVSAMTFFVTIIALVVIASNIINNIQESMKNLGALKAVGYTGGQLIGSLFFQFLGITLIAFTAGAILSYCLFPAVNEMMISQTGIPYEVRFLWQPLFFTFAVINGAVAVTVGLSSYKIRSIEPITALRQGIKIHNFRKNHFPLEHTRIKLNTVLALKTTVSGVKQNITICITMLVLSLIIVFSGVMIRNVIFDMQPMIELIVGEMADAGINVTAEQEKEFLEAAEEDERVEKVYLYNNIEVSHVGHVSLNAIVTDDCTKMNNQKLCIEGRFPRYDNELLLGAKYAKEQGLKVGDKIILTADGNEEEFIICGFTQTSNYLGKDCLMLRSGYERMGTLLSIGYCFNMAEGTDIDAFLQDISEKIGEGIEYTVNIQEATIGTAAVYVSVITMIVAAILVLSMIVIAFVLFLLVRTLLTRRKRDYGILKALGFTTRQLILQTAISFMPTLLFSLAAGLALSILVINPLIALFLRGIGMIKCTFEIPVGFIAAAGLVISMFAFGFICLLSLKIRNIAPKILIDGE